MSSFSINVIEAKNGQYIANVPLLEKVLLNPRIKNLPVCVISVAGVFRMGKSFLLNLMLKYLHEGNNWRNDTQSVLDGFAWRCGSKPLTSGIHMLIEPIILKKPSGEEVALILLDTEGTFDTNSTLKQNATIFALSTLLSSVQIYNLADNILEDGLQYLQFFTEYGRLAMDTTPGKPLQKLLFLVRDWSYPSKFPYGATGGDGLLEHRFMKKELEQLSEADMNSAQKLRKHIVECFNEIRCFLLPHPGLTVATSPDFKGKLSDIEPEFMDNVSNLFAEIFSPDKITVKQLDGMPVTGGLLFQLFTKYDEIFRSGDLPEPKLAFEMTSMARNRFCVEQAKDIYRNIMEKECGEDTPYLSSTEMQTLHDSSVGQAVHAFDKSKLFGGARLVEESRVLLFESIEKYRCAFFESNEKKTQLSLRNAIFLIAVTYLVYTLSGVTAWLGMENAATLLMVFMFLLLAVLSVWCHGFFSTDEHGWGRMVDRRCKPIADMVIAYFGADINEQKKKQ